MIEDKIQIDMENAKAQKELKGLVADLDIAKKEKVALDSMIERNKKLIEEQSEELKSIMNDIASQKLEWLHEKDKGMKELEDKKSEIDAILARSIELDKKEDELNALHEEIKAVRNENSTILLDTKAKETEIDVKIAHVERKMIDISQKEHDIDVKIINFKEQVEKVIKELIKI